jgi:hypothetical protein
MASSDKKREKNECRTGPKLGKGKLNQFLLSNSGKKM